MIENGAQHSGDIFNKRFILQYFEWNQPSLLITDNDLHFDSDEFMAPAGPLFIKVSQKNTDLKLYLTS